MLGYFGLLVAVELAYFVAIAVPLIVLWAWLDSRDAPYSFEIGLTIAIFAFFILPWRAKMTAEMMHSQNVGFLKAHRLASSEIRAHLSFLPLVGHLFGSERHDPPKPE
jgi:hypothetical protein